MGKRRSPKKSALTNSKSPKKAPPNNRAKENKKLPSGLYQEPLQDNFQDLNQPIEYQGFNYEHPDRRPGPTRDNPLLFRSEYARYSQGGLWQYPYNVFKTTPYFSGPHEGKGPQKIFRSDEKIQESVYEVLTRHPSIDAQEIEVEAKNGVVTLSGHVPERPMKYFAEESTAANPGVYDVINNIRVKKTSAH